MADFDALIYPPGITLSEAAIYGQRSFQTAPASNEPLIISYNNNNKYSFTEAKLRILSCCRDLGISQTNAVKYPDLQRAYKLKFDIELGREELFNLFSNRNATNSLKEGLRSFMHIIEASKTDDNTIRLKLRDDSDEYIKELEARYEGPPFQPLTPEQVDSIFNPQKRENFYRNNRNENGRYYQSRGCGNGARYISRNNRNDGSQYPQQQQQQQYGNRYDGPQSLYDNRSYNNNGGSFNYQNNYSQNSNFQRPFNLNQNPNNYSNNRYSQGPMAAFIDEQKVCMTIFTVSQIAF
uniref:DUF7516 domain-containing protein n=1 Tax=Panagrolaimus superbus TaxID=310955 RepID=A0A914YDG4_9BILA